MKLQRDQVVAASLVGTVVVVLGFASGIGGVPQAQSVPPPTPPRPTQHEQPHPPAEHVPQPVAHNPVPAAHVPAPHVPAPSYSHPSVPSPTTSVPTTTSSAPARPCDAGGLTKLLHDLGLLIGDLPIVGELTEGTKAVDELPLLGGLLPPLELPDGCKVVVDDRTGKITGLLGTP
ncbi:hypothetical protein Lesp02_53190 [Lentzea sp. NBRC 105346]|uniref:hypothetical protein n=1 Tax=Lentzea sp. NBRC 105346 TaxID=3032205 RepID=UPI0024A55BDA|nr:hypothetical protein [Lentzea sp. NBRC 105346]GLZ33131.1 hypothetical protein Lesp02_53190 [Lentzea sp. NBRC 105346]